MEHWLRGSQVSKARPGAPTDRKGSALGFRFSELYDPARQPSVYASLQSLARSQARLEARMESLLLSRRALPSPTMCRFIPAPLCHLFVVTWFVTVTAKVLGLQLGRWRRSTSIIKHAKHNSLRTITLLYVRSFSLGRLLMIRSRCIRSERAPSTPKSATPCGGCTAESVRRRFKRSSQNPKNIMRAIVVT